MMRPESSGPVLSAHRLSVVRGRGPQAHTVVSGLDLDIFAGEIIGISGRSGAGKSSLIAVFAGELLPSGGSVTIRTQNFAGPPREIRQRCPGSIAIVSQDPMATLDGLWTIGQSIAEPLRVSGLPRRDLKPRTRAALESVGLGKLSERRLPREVSLGQAQRICLARALVSAPALLLADEPTSALDVVSAARTIDLFREIAASGTAVVIVSHDYALLKSASTRRLELSDGRLQSPVD